MSTADGGGSQFRGVIATTLTIQQDAATIVVNTSSSEAVWAMAFHPDGKHLLGGGMNGLRRWRIADGEEVGEQIGMNVRAISVSRDHKWVVCGTTWGVSVWDAEIREKAIEVESTHTVTAIDISPDSTTLATVRYGKSEAFIWSIITGEKLVGPLQHDKAVSRIKFSPNSGEHKVATVCEGGSIRIFDSRNGDQLIHINSTIPGFSAVTSVMWSNDEHQILAVASKDKRIKVLDVTTGSQLAESHVFNGASIGSIAPAANGKFIAAITDPSSISLLDASTLAQVGPVIQDSDSRIWSIALSPDGSHLATGGYNGKIVIRNLSNILQESVGYYHFITGTISLISSLCARTPGGS